ncbi:hypothetical protein KQX54_007643 [Cotesia glomerata]|uniref:Uncharacterized protein n=1 Tax=Cotesia glomerata TaxID=32391 RepID=A0AAV7IQQ6_COTGL|nr:hypothetical protein KQX54_007643 [Cotesia glomerata]
MVLGRKCWMLDTSERESWSYLQTEKDRIRITNRPLLEYPVWDSTSDLVSYREGPDPLCRSFANGTVRVAQELLREQSRLNVNKLQATLDAEFNACISVINNTIELSECLCMLVGFPSILSLVVLTIAVAVPSGIFLTLEYYTKELVPRNPQKSYSISYQHNVLSQPSYIYFEPSSVQDGVKCPKYTKPRKANFTLSV